VLNRARMRDEVAKRTGYRPDVVAHLLDVLEGVVRDELMQQGEVVFRGLFRITPGIRTYAGKPATKHVSLLEEQRTPVSIRRIVLAIRPVRSLRRKLSEVPLPG
jgi:hypothetical protein